MVEDDERFGHIIESEKGNVYLLKWIGYKLLAERMDAIEYKRVIESIRDEHEAYPVPRPPEKTSFKSDFIFVTKDRQEIEYEIEINIVAKESERINQGEQNE